MMTGKIESKLTNCIIVPKDDDDYLFHAEGGFVYANLDGYAIIPTEEYHLLKGKKESTQEKKKKS